MGLTINVNSLTLCHKGSGGVVVATVPDVCKTPSPSGPVPIPYPNTAFSKDLVKGSKKVTADGGNSIAIKGSEFSMSIGDEPGTAGGVKSGVNKSVASWISFSPNVKIEGKNACRLSDKMFLNKGNTVSMCGLGQPPLTVDELKEELCDMACECKNAARFQNCVAGKIKERYYDGAYPKADAPMWQEVSMSRGGDGWGIIKNGAGTAPTSNPYTPRGGIRPDIVATDGCGNPTSMIEMKFPGDAPNANQMPGGKYDQAARDLGIEYDSVTVEDDCAHCWEEPPGGSPVPIALPEKSTLEKVGDALDKVGEAAKTVGEVAGTVVVTAAAGLAAIALFVMTGGSAYA